MKTFVARTSKMSGSLVDQSKTIGLSIGIMLDAVALSMAQLWG
jgi:hypothetical protein